jgi:hypothetical protein
MHWATGRLPVEELALVAQALRIARQLLDRVEELRHLEVVQAVEDEAARELATVGKTAQAIDGQARQARGHRDADELGQGHAAPAEEGCAQAGPTPFSLRRLLSFSFLATKSLARLARV